MNLFITGGTGFLGREVLVRLLKQKLADRIFVLIRPNHKQDASQRLEALLDKVVDGDLRERASLVCEAVSGDLTANGLGIDGKYRSVLSQKVDHILHVGASTDFSAPLGESRLFNVVGTQQVLDFALDCKESGGLKRFDYVSTAFVAGIKKGAVKENDLDRGQDFANNYERTKFEAEVLVNKYHDKLPICVMRPSIVVGNSMTGFTPHFKVLYWPLKILAKNILPFIPVSGYAKLDVVPVDYVAEGMVCLMKQNKTLGETYYLTAGMGNEVNIATVMNDAIKYAGIKKVPRVPIWVLDVMKKSFLGRLFSDEAWDIVDLTKTYTAYFMGKGVYFDSRKTASLLEKHGVVSKPWKEYSKNILGFCKSTRWGRKLPKSEAEFYKQAIGM